MKFHRSPRSARFLALALALALALVAAGCGGEDAESTTTAADDTSTTAPAGGDLESSLTIGVYGGRIGDAIDEVFVSTFEAETGVEVTMETGFDNARLTKLQAEPESLDIAMFTDPILPDVRAAGIPASLTEAEIPNLAAVSPDFRSDDSVALSIAVWGIAYNQDEVVPAPTSWRDLLNPEYEGLVTSPDVTYNSSILSLDAFARLGGGSLLGDVDPGFELMAELRELSPFFWASSSDMLSQLQSGAIVMSPYASGGTRQAAEEPGGEHIAFAVPEEGGYPVPFNVVINVNSTSPNAARAFVNHLLDADRQAAWIQQYNSLPANTETVIPDDVRSHLGDVGLDDLVHVDWSAFAEIRDEIVERWQREIQAGG